METARGPTEQHETLNDEYWETLDIPAGGWCVMKDHQPSFRRDGNKILMVFKATDKLFEDLKAYTRGDHCNANQFAQICKQLKGRILSLKNGERNGNTYQGRNSKPY